MAGSTRSSFTRDLLITGVFAAAAILGLSASGFTVSRGYVESPKDAQAEIALVRSREIIDSVVVGEGEDAVVTYAYKGDPLPGKLAEDEVVAKRTESSYTRLLGVENKGTADERLILETISYARPTFTIRGDAWYYIEFDTTQKSYFTEATAVAYALPWTARIARAASISPFSTAGDGYVSYSDFSPDWNAAHDAVTGDAIDYTSSAMNIGSNDATNSKVAAITIARGFVPFDTSAMPAGSVISAATLNLYLFGKSVTDNDGNDFLTIVESSQASHTTLATADYDQAGAINSPTEGIDAGQRKDISSSSTGGYLAFTLNSTGRGWIKGTGQASTCSATNGITCFAIREGHDAVDDPVTLDQTSIATLSTSEASGTSQDPYLSVTYTAQSFAFWQFQDF